MSSARLSKICPVYVHDMSNDMSIVRPLHAQHVSIKSLFLICWVALVCIVTQTFSQQKRHIFPMKKGFCDHWQAQVSSSKACMNLATLRSAFCSTTQHLSSSLAASFASQHGPRGTGKLFRDVRSEDADADQDREDQTEDWWSLRPWLKTRRMEEHLLC